MTGTHDGSGREADARGSIALEAILDGDARDGPRYRRERRIRSATTGARASPSCGAGLLSWSAGAKCRGLAGCADQTEPALPTLVAGDGVEQVALGEVGPEHVREVQLGVGQARRGGSSRSGARLRSG